MHLSLSFRILTELKKICCELDQEERKTEPIRGFFSFLIFYFLFFESVLQRVLC